MSKSNQDFVAHDPDEGYRRVLEIIESETDPGIDYESAHSADEAFITSDNWTSDGENWGPTSEDPPEWLLSVPPNLGDNSVQFEYCYGSSPEIPPAPQ